MTITHLLLSSGLMLFLPSPPQRFEFMQPHMGTQFRIVLYAPDKPAAEKAVTAAFARIAELDAMMSDYKETSELMQLCKKAGGPPVRVSDELFLVLAKSQDLARRTEGAFDVTVGPVVRLWRRARRQRELPDAKRLAQAMELVGYQKMKLDAEKKTVQLEKPGMLLDLGGIAKGYAGDEAIRVLSKMGITSALVAAGGDIVVTAPPPGTDGWTVGIAPLETPDQRPSRYLLLKNAAVSTSGDAEQYVEIAGVRYSHIIDPRTGVGLRGRRSVTVVASSGIAADGLDTAVCVLGEKGLKLIEATDGASALILEKTEQGERVLRSTKWKELSRPPHLPMQ